MERGFKQKERHDHPGISATSLPYSELTTRYYAEVSGAATAFATTVWAWGIELQPWRLS
jgi:hypothetical protein